MKISKNTQRWLKVVFLLGVLAGASGYRFRCWWMCTDQTSVQNDYIEQRDSCRSYAQTKIDFAMKNQPGPKDEKNRKATLVALFSECMSQHGWNVPDGKPAAPPVAAAPAPVVPPVDITASKEKESREKAALSRASECAFARHAAAISSNSAARARACDIECAQRLKSAPDAPRPAACPSGPTPTLDSGRDTVD